MAHYGIDLGTSNCLVARVTQNLDDSFAVKCLSDEDGNDSFPSVVYFETPQTYRVGEVALKRLSDAPDSTVELVKVRLGKTDTIEVKAGTAFTKSPQEISSYLLSHLNALHRNAVKDAIITVPAFFDQSQKDATMQAGSIAGMTPKYLIEEPTAAIMYHIFSEYKDRGLDYFEGKPERKVLVFDFGGGTLDLSLISLSLRDRAVDPKVLAIGGDPELGGNIIDFVFVKVILSTLIRLYPDDSFLSQAREAFSDYFSNYMTNNRLAFTGEVPDEVKNFLFRLRRNLEQAKIQLSNADKVRIVLERNYRPLEMTREQFEKSVLSSDELDLREKIESALGQISKTREPISEVLLIGGSAQIPFVRGVIADTLCDMGVTRDRIRLSADFSRAVAMGAAIQAAIADGVAVPPFHLNKCESIVARDIELEHSGKRQLFVEMGTPYPFAQKKAFPMKIGHALSETVSLNLNEIITKPGQPDTRKQICGLVFHLPIYYTNDDIKVSLGIDEAGLYQIEVAHSSTGEAVEFEPIKRFSLSAGELKKAQQSAKQMTEIIS